MAKAYKIVEFYNETTDDEIYKLASLFSDESDFIKSDNRKIVILKFSVESYISNLDIISKEIGKTFVFPIITNFKFIDLLKNKEQLTIEFLGAKFRESNSELEEKYTEEFNSYIYTNELNELSQELESYGIQIERLNFKMKNSNQIGLTRSSTLYTDVSDLKNNKSSFINIANFVISGEIYE